LPSVLLHQSEYAARRHDATKSRALLAEAVAAGPADGVDRARYFSDGALADWPAAASDARAYAVSIKGEQEIGQRLQGLAIRTRITPLLAQALARSGDVRGAQAQIDATPSDCYACIRTRGLVAAVEKQRGRSDYWFARAVHDAPSVPFAYSDWGQALLIRGDADAAIAKFTIANQKGPHFADPLELWGEALMAKNQSHLALAKFEEAEKYAPNWGRLHLKWGEALVYAGEKDEAKKQFARTIGLGLTPTEKSELARVNHG
jgi:tetratricopeptide (TPR) repeat protein